MRTLRSLQFWFTALVIVGCIAAITTLPGCGALTGKDLRQQAFEYYPAQASTITNVAWVAKQVAPAPTNNLVEIGEGLALAILGAFAAYKHAEGKVHKSYRNGNGTPLPPTTESEKK